MSVKDIIMGQVFPVLGGVLGIIMFGSPIKAAYRTRLQQAIGDLNPFPFVVTVVNCATWNAYGFAARDYNMFFCNIPGLAIGLYTSITTYPFASRRMQDLMLGILVSGALLVMVLGVLSAWVMSAAQSRLLWGFTCNSITIAYYAAPLSTALQVIRTRNSATIYLPTIICNFVNASLWLGYGLAVWDPFIYVPNGAGAACAVLLIVLCIIFPKKNVGGKGTSSNLPEKGLAATEGDACLDITDKQLPSNRKSIEC